MNKMNKRILIIAGVVLLAVVLVVVCFASKDHTVAQTGNSRAVQTAVVPDGPLEIPTYTRPREHSQQIAHKA